MSTASGHEVISIDYTLAPRADWHITTDQVLAVWKAVLASGVKAESVGMMGDSAGGNLAAASVLKMRDQHLPLPGALYLISPGADQSGAGDTYTTLAAADPILSTETTSWSADAYSSVCRQEESLRVPGLRRLHAGFSPDTATGRHPGTSAQQLRAGVPGHPKRRPRGGARCL